MSTCIQFEFMPLRVLVVDDDMTHARALGRALTHLGIEVSVADGPQRALRDLEARAFDAMVVDLRMPGMSGLEFLRRASGERAFPPSILHSAYLDVPTTVEAMRAG